ncbi:carbon-nitrogen family hydrolase [Fusobacterium sp. PH5-44]|uniref:carbon-nitrogen family hydrolase n=1 Tax=unclassified Fusobacterium TaxID=2648384 RepID=UPI003D2624FB
MKISLIQPKLILGDVNKNYNMIEQEIRESTKENPDVIVLPEMWNTSFFPKNVKELADLNGERTRKLLSSLSKEFNVNIVGGSVANLVGEELYNTSFIFDRTGKEIALYNKVHLFSPSGEHNVFKSGNKLCIFYLDGVKCGLSICYDIRFVEWIRRNALENIEVFFLPAAWPDKRTMHWDTLNRARAIENQMFVVCTNSLGEAGDMKFGGHSSIIDPWGEYVVVPDDICGIKTGEVDLSIIKGIRNSINVFRDRKENLY